MARIIRSRDCIGMQYDGKKDPARHETQSETIRRLGYMIKTLGKVVADLIKFGDTSPKIENKIEDLNRQRKKCQQDLDSYTR